MTPEIRFKGFTQDWEQRKLGEVTQSYSGGTPSVEKTEYYNGTIPFIRSAEINSNITELYITESGLNSSSAKMVEVGNILYALYGATSGEVGISRINGAINQAILAIQPEINYDSQFIMQWLRGQKQNIIVKYLQGGQGNLSGSIVKNLLVEFPSYAEQQKIAQFFKQLDETIALHQDKLEKLNQLRNGYLQIIFPQNDEKTPRLRFANFSSDWKKRKLEDLATFFKGSGYTKSDLVEEGTPIILYGRLYTKYQTIIEHVDTFVNMKEKSVLSEGDEVIVPSSGESSEDIARASVVATAGILLGGDLNIIKTISDINSTFLALNISNGKQQKELSKKAQGKSVVHLHNSDLKKIDLTYPVVEVQIQIGNFFKQLDRTITLQHNKTEKLKQLKKIYLQKLFV